MSRNSNPRSLLRQSPTLSHASRHDNVFPPSSPTAPMIQISHSLVHAPLKGADNPAFVDEETAEICPWEVQSPPPPQIKQRSNSVFASSSASLHNLTVPEPGSRRQSLASENVLNEVKTELAPLTISIDHLSMPRTPRLKPSTTPGALSGRSGLLSWSDTQDLDNLSIASEASNRSLSGISSNVSVRLHNLVRRFSNRTEYFKEKTIQPPTPSTTDSEHKSVISGSSAISETVDKGRQHRLDSFIPMSSAGSGLIKEERFINLGLCKVKSPAFLQKLYWDGTIESQSKIYLFWLFLVSSAFLYNAVFLTLRAAFRRAPFATMTQASISDLNSLASPIDCQDMPTSYPDSSGIFENVSEVIQSMSGLPPNTSMISPTSPGMCQSVSENRIRYKEGYETDENRIYWWICDYIADFLYIIDILFVKHRIRFIKDGLVESNKKEMAKNYFKKRDFRMDILSLTPLDLLYLIPQVKYNSLVRLPRLLKIQTFWEFYDRLDQTSSSGHVVRVARTLTYMLYLIHLESCGYFAMSAYEGLKFNDWVYDGEGIAYVRCMYLATKTATSIGNNPKPTNDPELVFMTVYWLSGVFVFAMLIGQIRDIFHSAGIAKARYRKTMDQTLGYMQTLELPEELQSKVRTWFTYNWEHQKTLDENSLLEALPPKMKADLGIHVHFQTLSKVQLFQDCDKSLLFDLVLKLKPVLYLPRDYICRKGEIGTEMYIVKQGQVEVVGGENDSIVFATLYEGSVFGEISLLALAGGNRRTASVRSKGFSNLFILSKVDFEEAMKDNPEAQKLLKKRAKRVLAKNAKKEKEADSEQKMESEEVIIQREGTPKLLKTVVQLMEPDSQLRGRLESLRGSMSSSQRPSLQPSLSKTQDSIWNVSIENSDNWDASSYEEDEILVVEQTETDLPLVVEQTETDLPSTEAPNAEGRSLETQSFTGIPTLSLSPVKDSHKPQPLRRASDSTVASAVGSILGTPSRSPASLLPRRANKVEPAIFTFESDVHEESPKRSASIKPKSASSSASSRRQSPALKKSNKIGIAPDNSSQPSALDKKDGTANSVQIPLENKVTCSVEVHREKSPSVVSEVKGGVDNLAYEGSGSIVAIHDSQGTTAGRSETPL